MKTFVSYIAHEVRSPLSTAVLALDCLTEVHSKCTCACAAEADELTEDCRFSCDAAVHVLNDILLVDKLENKMVTLELSTIGAKEFLLDNVRPYRRQVIALDNGLSMNNDMLYLTIIVFISY